PQSDGSNTDGQDTAPGQEAAQTAPDVPQSDGSNTGGQDTAPAQEATQTATDALQDGDGSAADGQDTAPAQEAPQKAPDAPLNDVFTKITDGGCVTISGKIRRVFDGVLRVRNRASWESSAVAGVTNFEEKEVVSLLNVEGKPMFKMLDGYFITGDPALVEYVEK
ncbi:MAG: hypothetical protein HDT26_02565, partial [Subdoligranulum sp.]|nr:hypothetical protein [Subdoligranulum sp.]